MEMRAKCIYSIHIDCLLFAFIVSCIFQAPKATVFPRTSYDCLFKTIISYLIQFGFSNFDNLQFVYQCKRHGIYWCVCGLKITWSPSDGTLWMPHALRPWTDCARIGWMWLDVTQVSFWNHFLCHQYILSRLIEQGTWSLFACVGNVWRPRLWQDRSIWERKPVLTNHKWPRPERSCCMLLVPTNNETSHVYSYKHCPSCLLWKPCRFFYTWH
jgi:hypothetical protein